MTNCKDLVESDRSPVEDRQTPGLPTVQAGFERGTASTQMQSMTSRVSPHDYTFTAVRDLNLFNDTAYTLQVLEVRTSVLYGSVLAATCRQD